MRHQSVKDCHSIASLQNRPPLKAIMNNLERNLYKILNMHKILAKGLIKHTSPTYKKKQTKQTETYGNSKHNKMDLIRRN